MIIAYFFIAFFVLTASATPKETQSVSEEQKLSVVSGIDYRISDNKITIEIFLSGDIDISHSRLKSPERIYIDLLKSKLGSIKNRNIVINDPDIKGIRAAQNNIDKVRVVFDVSNGTEYSIKKISVPDKKIVLELLRSPGNKKDNIQPPAQQPPSPIIPTSPSPIPDADSSPLKNTKPEVDDKKNEASSDKGVAYKKGIKDKLIVVDAGHGGKDPGALGVIQGLEEKYIVLDISKKLANMIKKRLGCKVLLTRDKDIFIPVKDRPITANAKDADLFISIHINADTDNRTGGIETYYLSPTKSRESLKTVARENSVTIAEMEKSDLDFILADLASTFKINESIILANHVHKHLVSNVKDSYDDLRDLGLKKGPFYVLLGAKMPGILVEALFITNKREASFLAKAKNRTMIAESLFKGISEYIKEDIMGYNKAAVGAE